MSYIEREKIWPALNAACVPYNRATAKAIEDIPAADVRPVVRGKWIEFPAALAYKDAYCDTHIVCSACEAVFDIMDNCTETFNYCPNCGAEMREPKEES